MKNAYLAILILFIFLSSCTLQKRKYRDGFYNSTTKHKNTLKQIDNVGSETNSNKTENTFIANTSNEIVLPNKESFLITSETPDTNKCDVITLRDNQELDCIISEIGTTEIRYKKCDNPTGPTFIIAKSEVFFITYKNGSVDLINSKSEPKVETPINNQNNNSSSNNTNNNKPVKQSNADNERSMHRLVKWDIILAIASFFTFGLVFVAPILGIVGIILSIKALSKIKAQPEKYKGKALAIACLIAFSIIIVYGIYILTLLI
jgi:hypothetical protein